LIEHDFAPTPTRARSRSARAGGGRTPTHILRAAATEKNSAFFRRAADKIRRKSARRVKNLMKFGGILLKLIKFMSFLEKKYVFFSKNIVFSSFYCCKIWNLDSKS
jgi:hypothetical protein